MSRLQLFILWILALGTGYLFVTYKFNDEENATKTNLTSGTPLLDPSLIETMSSFKVSRGADTVTVNKVENKWVVEELAQYPANFNSIDRIVESLRNAKVSQGIIATEEYYNRFKLDPNAEKPTDQPEIITLFSDGEEKATVYLGKNRSSTNGGRETNAGRFVRLANDQSGIYIISNEFTSFTATPSSWIDTTLTPLDEGVIKFEVTAPNDPSFQTWTASRKNVIEKLTIENIEEGFEINPSEIDILTSTLVRSSFLELLTKEEAEERGNSNGLRHIKATDSAGTTYLFSITPVKTEAAPLVDMPAGQPQPLEATQFVLTIEILNGPTMPEPVAEDAHVDEKSVHTQRVLNFGDLSKRVNKLSKLYQDRHFLVNRATVGSFDKSRSDFLKESKPAREPATVNSPPIRVPTRDNPNPNQLQNPTFNEQVPHSLVRPPEIPETPTQETTQEPPAEEPPAEEPPAKEPSENK